MRPTFVKTENFNRFLAGLLAMKDRGAQECCFLILDGDPGLGKTTIINRWVTQEGGIYLRAKKEWTAAWMLRELLGELKTSPEYSFEKMYRQAVRELSRRSAEAERDGSTFALVVDEADHICRRESMLETLRDLSDHLEIPVILVGMGRIRDSLTRYRQISSRVAQPVEFKPCSLADVQALVKGLCEVEVAEDLVEQLLHLSKGYTREIKEGIAAIERLGRRSPGHVIDCAAMDGVQLLIDRRTGNPIKVRAER
ncbi:MAG: ATP-binding protein [Magnetospirillum sp.]|nr:ATP-binding protein [Magnetospirillum sp.]